MLGTATNEVIWSVCKPPKQTALIISAQTPSARAAFGLLRLREELPLRSFSLDTRQQGGACLWFHSSDSQLTTSALSNVL